MLSALARRVLACFAHHNRVCILLLNLCTCILTRGAEPLCYKRYECVCVDFVVTLFVWTSIGLFGTGAGGMGNGGGQDETPVIEEEDAFAVSQIYFFSGAV